MPRRYKQGADGQPHPAFYGKLPEEFSKADTMRFVVENLKIVQGSKGLFLGMPSQPDGKGGYRDMAYPVTKEFREQLNTAVLQAYEAKLEQMAERGSVGRASISDQLKAGKAAAEQAKAERPPKEKPSRSAER